MSEGTLPPGTKLGSYTVLEALGHGGMGVVYKARDERQGRVVALKVLSRELAGNPRFRARFEREAKAAAAVTHRNVTAFLFVGEDRGLLHIALEYVPRGTLRSLLKERGVFEPLEAAALAAQIARGLAAIHAVGLVHRDVKPANILMDEEGRPKLTDFGIVGTSVESRVELAKSLTRTGELLGTLQYVAPEQIEDAKRVDARADLYALGCLLHMLIAGRAPFEGIGYELVKKHLADAPPPLRRVVPRVPVPLERLVLRLLEKDPAARPATALEVAEELEEIAGSRQAAAPAKAPASRVAIGFALGLPIAAGLVVTAALLVPRDSKESEPSPPATTNNAEKTGDPKEPPRPASFPDSTRSFLLSQKGTARLTQVFGSYDWKHSYSVYAALPTPDGKRIVDASRDGTAVVWDAATGTELVRFREHGICVYSLALSPDGALAATGSIDGMVRIWEVATGKPVRTLEPPELGCPCHDGKQVNSIDFSRDGSRIVTACSDHRIRWWDARDGTFLGMLSDEKPVWTARFLPGAKRVVAGCEEPAFPVRVWDLETRKSTDVAERGGGFVHIAVSRAGDQAFVGSFDGEVHVLDLLAGRESATWKAHPNGVTWPAFSPLEGALLTGSIMDDKVQLWDVATRATRRTFPCHGHAVRSVSFFPDGSRAVSAGEEGALRLWDLERGQEIAPSPGHRSEVWAIAFLRDGKRFVTGSRDGTLRVWDAATGREERAIEVPDAVLGLALSQDGTQALTAGPNGTVRLWDTTSWKMIRALEGHTGLVRALALSLGAKFAVTGGEDERVILWNLSTGEKVWQKDHEKEREPDQQWSDFVAFAGDLVLATSGNLILALDAKTGKLESTKKAGHLVDAALQLQDGRIVTCGRDGSLKLWGLGKDDAVRELKGQPQVSYGVAVSPDQKRLVTAALDGKIRIWSTESQEPVDEIDLGPSFDHGFSAAFAPDGKSFLVGTARGVILRFELASAAQK
ncbi:serine/threonine protein kinase [bacterium]|nr:serine/threonine protein kinase [bacterium]